MTEMIDKVANSIKNSEYMTSDHEPDYKELAKAAIKAMREPTEEMLEAGPLEPYMDCNVWADMIDKALEE